MLLCMLHLHQSRLLICSGLTYFVIYPILIGAAKKQTIIGTVRACIIHSKYINARLKIKMGDNWDFKMPAKVRKNIVLLCVYSLQSVFLIS